ncbi:MAG: hypothetical protein Ct9H300mP14_11060 [Gammaproteobacteria bacterium]|nr:MAG: hypothetical protein Ct9H300mP14_11060 [Gammaproteobacteria bacterium]
MWSLYFPECLMQYAIGERPDEPWSQVRLSWPFWDPREFTDDSFRRVDDRPYGGGPGW